MAEGPMKGRVLRTMRCYPQHDSWKLRVNSKLKPVGDTLRRHKASQCGMCRIMDMHFGSVLATLDHHESTEDMRRHKDSAHPPKALKEIPQLAKTASPSRI